MRALAILVGAVALALPAAALANGGGGDGARERDQATAGGLFVAVAVEVCKERQLRPFGHSPSAERWARKGGRKCVKRLLGHERLLVRGVLACTEKLAESETLSRRALSDCLVGVLLRKLGLADDMEEPGASAGERSKKDPPKQEPPKQDEGDDHGQELEAVLACKQERADDAFAEEHEGLSFAEFYGEGDELDERETFARCVKSKTSDGD